MADKRCNICGWPIRTAQLEHGGSHDDCVMLARAGRTIELARAQGPGGGEADIVVGLLLALGTRDDLTIWRNNTGALRREGPQAGFVQFGLTGSADILGIAKPGGWLVAIEAKRPGEKRSAQQERFALMVEAHGGIYILADHGVAPALAALDQKLAQWRAFPAWTRK